jgi:hypothetical protein
MSGSGETALDRTPDVYLRHGYRDTTGAIRPELLEDDAVNAAKQLELAEVAPQEMAFVYEALRLVLPLHTGDASDRFNSALGEALSVVQRMIRQPNNEGLAKWCRACAAHIHDEEDITAFREHMLAVMRIYTIFTDLPPPDEASSSSEPS